MQVDAHVHDALPRQHGALCEARRRRPQLLRGHAHAEDGLCDDEGEEVVHPAVDAIEPQLEDHLATLVVQRVERAEVLAQDGDDRALLAVLVKRKMGPQLLCTSFTAPPAHPSPSPPSLLRPRPWAGRPPATNVVDPAVPPRRPPLRRPPLHHGLLCTPSTSALPTHRVPQIIMFSDLEMDYVNPIELCKRLNMVLRARGPRSPHSSPFRKWQRISH